MKVWQPTDDDRVRLVFKGCCGWGDAHVHPNLLGEPSLTECPECGKPMKYLRTELQEERATAKEIEVAESMHANPDLAIDQDARASHSDDGVWVSAWAYVSNSDLEDTDDSCEEDQD